MTFMDSIAYPLGLLMTMLVFIRAYPPKKLFYLRLIPFLGGALALNYVVLNMLSSQLYVFLMFLAEDVLLGIGFSLAFRISPMQLFAVCTSGVALQHMSYHMEMLLLLFFPQISMTVGLELGIVAGMSLLFVLIFGKRIERIPQPTKLDRRLLLISVGIVLICIGITRFTRVGWDHNRSIQFALSAYAIISCALSLFLQYFLCSLIEAETEKTILNHLHQEEQLHYDISRETAEQLHIIYHDLKHKLTALRNQLPERELETMQQALDDFSNNSQTGLDALDVVLSEKNRLARSRGATITFMGNGQDFAFMDPLDLYSLFGNLLDNAITAVGLLPEQEQRLISVTSERHGSFQYLIISNYLHSSDELPMYEGLPVSSKMEEHGFHGYGLRSVRAIARKYNGDIMISTMDRIFSVTVYMLQQ